MATAKVISKVVTEVAMERQAVTLDSATQAVITEFVATRDMLTSLEKTKKALEAKIREALGEAEAGIVDGVVRSLRSHTNSYRVFGACRQITTKSFGEAPHRKVGGFSLPKIIPKLAKVIGKNAG